MPKSASARTISDAAGRHHPRTRHAAAIRKAAGTSRPSATAQARRAAIRRRSTICCRRASARTGTASAMPPRSGTTMPALRWRCIVSERWRTARRRSSLGTDLRNGERPQAIVPANWWQSAETTRRLHAGRLHRRARASNFRASRWHRPAGSLRRLIPIRQWRHPALAGGAGSCPMRGKHGAARDQQAGAGNAPARLGKAEQRQDQRRQQRRRIAGGAEDLDIAVLDAVVPGVEGSADRQQAETDDSRPTGSRFPARPCVSSPRWQSSDRTDVARQKPVTTSVETASKRRVSSE